MVIFTVLTPNIMWFWSFFEASFSSYSGGAGHSARKWGSHSSHFDLSVHKKHRG